MSFENLHVYQAAQLLRAEVDKLAKTLDQRFVELYAHLDDAVDSIMNNLAEGNQSEYPRRRVNYYDIAAGSAREARGALRSLDQRGGFKGANVTRAVLLTFTVGKMIQALIGKEKHNPDF